MSTKISETFDGMVLNAPVADRTLNNGAGGTAVAAWLAGSGGFLSDGAGKVKAQTSYSVNAVNVAGVESGRIWVDPEAAFSNYAFYGLCDSTLANGVHLLFAGGHTSLRVCSVASGSRTDQQSAEITAPSAPFWLEFEANAATKTITARILNEDTSVRNQVSYTFPGAFPSGGDHWAFGMYGDNDKGLFDNFILDDGGSADSEKPALAGTPTVGTKTSSTIQITGPAGSDNVGITAYEFSLDGGATWPLSSPTLPYNITDLAALTGYTVGMRAKDAAGNISDPILATTSTYRAGALASTVLLLTGPQDGNPAGFLYAFAGTVQPGDWLSWRTVSGPVPAGGELDANAMGAFSYQGPSPATLVIQPEVNGVDAAETITVTLYDGEQAGLVLAARATVAQARSKGGALVFGALEPLALAARPTVAQALSKGGAISFGGLAPLVLSARGTVAQARSRGGAMVFDNSGGGMDPAVFSSKLRRVVVKDDKAEVLARYTMRPRERLDYCFNFAPWLDDCADTIAAYTVTASSAGIAVQQQGRDSGLVAAFVVASSTVTVPAKLTCEITTAAGRVKEACVYITVQEAMA